MYTFVKIIMEEEKTKLIGKNNSKPREIESDNNGTIYIVVVNTSDVNDG